MKTVMTCLTLGLMATAALGADGRTSRSLGVSLGGPTLISQVQGTELPMPAPLSPVPEVQYSGPISGLPVMAPTVELYHNVRYRGERNIAPCARPVIVQIPDPCASRNSCCPTPCVNVQICVPECGCPCVKVTRCGNKVRYDYGKYAVDVVSAHGRVVVDYDD